VAPIGNVQLVRVLANNTYYIPPSGLHSQATLKGAISGPFRISGCTLASGAETGTDDNVFTVTSSAETQTFRLPIGQRVRTDTLVQLFRDSLQNVVVVNDDGYLSFTDVASVGAESRIRVSGRAAASLGFTGQVAARGKQVYPGWVLAKRDDILPMVNRHGQLSTHARYPQFVGPVHLNPTFKVTYATVPNRCPRCAARFVENDWRFTVQGDLVFIGNEDLLYQAALKILLTKLGSNPYHQAYGSKILDRIGLKAVGATAMLLQEDVRTALNRMQGLQRQQTRYQQVTQKERLYNILAVEVSPHRTDPTAFLVDVVVTNASGQPIELAIVFTVSGVAALAGTNNLSLGLNATGLTSEQARLFFNG
jgi:phage baseplate assembly protein W